LALHDPFDHTPVNIGSPLPAELTALLAALGMEGFAASADRHRAAPDYLTPR
jgi:hypothetical protein